MEVPRIEKIVINSGVGRPPSSSADRGGPAGPPDHHGPEAGGDQGEEVDAGFKLREGQAIGVKVTLRGDRAWEFFDRLISLAIPRIRTSAVCHRGLRRQRELHLRGDGAADLPRGRLRQHRHDAGMDITIVTTAKNDDEGRALLRAFGFPFRQETR